MRMWAKAGSKPALLEWLLRSGLVVPNTGVVALNKTEGKFNREAKWLAKGAKRYAVMCELCGRHVDRRRVSSRSRASVAKKPAT